MLPVDLVRVNRLAPSLRPVRPEVEATSCPHAPHLHLAMRSIPSCLPSRALQRPTLQAGRLRARQLVAARPLLKASLALGFKTVPLASLTTEWPGERPRLRPEAVSRTRPCRPLTLYTWWRLPR